MLDSQNDEVSASAGTDSPPDGPARQVPQAVEALAALAVFAEGLIRALLDELDEGIVVCDGERRAILVNRAARTELAGGEPLLLHEGRLVAADPSGAAALEAGIRSAARSGRRRLLALPTAAGRLFVAAIPMRQDALPTGLVVVLIGRRTVCQAPAIDMLADLHGLTGSERRVLGGLVAGLNPGRIAAAKGVELSTVRTQISSIRGKLGADSIDGLIRIAARLPSLTAALQQRSAQAH